MRKKVINGAFAMTAAVCGLAGCSNCNPCAAKNSNPSIIKSGAQSETSTICEATTRASDRQIERNQVDRGAPAENPRAAAAADASAPVREPVATCKPGGVPPRPRPPLN